MGSLRHATHWLLRLLSNPAWFSAITSLGAMIIAVIAALYARRMWLLERHRDEKVLETQLRSQAARVICVAARTGDRIWLGEDPHNLEDMEFSVPAVQIINRSDLPIFKITVTNPTMSSQARARLEDFGTSDEAIEKWYTTDRVPLEGETFLKVEVEDVYALLESKEVEYYDSYLDFHEDSTYACKLWEEHGRPAIEFTDAQGCRWKRDETGLLHLLSQPADSLAPSTRRRRPGLHLPIAHRRTGQPS